MPGLSISEWGPATWNFLHAVAHTQPVRLDADERTRVRRFLYDTAYLLPCKKCSRHFTDFLDEHASDDALSTRADIVRLLNDSHNEVNMKYNKRVVTLTEHYRIYSLDHRKPKNATVTWFLGLCVLGVLFSVTRGNQKNASYQ